MTEDDRLSKEFTRASERASWEKPFSFESDRIAGASNGQILRRYPKYKDAADLYKVCMLYGQSYSLTMVQRVLDEDPTYFEEKGINKDEF